MSKPLLSYGIKSRVFSVPKSGNSDEEYEDAAERDDASGSFALADGASDAVFARLWAELLVRRFIEAPHASRDPARWPNWVAPAQREWVRRATPVPWYVEAKVREGAYATFLGLRMLAEASMGRPHVWGAVAVGDACLFHVQAPGSEPSPAARGFPLTQAADFSNYPRTLCSNPSGNEYVWPYVVTTFGTWRPGDVFIMATDALSEWIISEIVPEQRWNRLLTLADAAAFRRLAETEWNEGRLRNDDLTLVIVRVPAVAGQPAGDNTDVALAG